MDPLQRVIVEILDCTSYMARKLSRAWGVLHLWEITQSESKSLELSAEEDTVEGSMFTLQGAQIHRIVCTPE